MKLFDVLDKLEKPEGIKDFPPVVVDQTNARIGDVIRRSLSGEQILGNNNLSFDYRSDSKNPNFERVNPFVDMGFDLDDVIALARRTGQQVSELMNRQSELKASLDEAKQQAQPEVQAPDAPKA